MSHYNHYKITHSRRCATYEFEMSWFGDVTKVVKASRLIATTKVRNQKRHQLGIFFSQSSA